MEEKKKWTTGDKGKSRDDEKVKRREREVKKTTGWRIGSDVIVRSIGKQGRSIAED